MVVDMAKDNYLIAVVLLVATIMLQYYYHFFYFGNQFMRHLKPRPLKIKTLAFLGRKLTFFNVLGIFMF